MSNFGHESVDTDTDPDGYRVEDNVRCSATFCLLGGRIDPLEDSVVINGKSYHTFCAPK